MMYLEFLCLRHLVALLVGFVLLTGTTDLLARHVGGRGNKIKTFYLRIRLSRSTESADLTRNDLKKFDQ